MESKRYLEQIWQFPVSPRVQQMMNRKLGEGNKSSQNVFGGSD
jgi:hypothetical protein